MRATKLIVVLAVALLSLPGLVWAATPDSRRLEGRLPDDSAVVSLAQPRGTVLDALSAITKQTGWVLVVTAPESANHPPAHHPGREAPRRRGARSGARGRLAPGLVRRRRPPRSLG